MIENVKQLSQSKDLLWAWIGRIIRGRYQQSALGWLWAIIQPAATVVIFSIIFTRIVPVDTGDIPYPVFSYLAVVPWTFLASSLSDMTMSLVANMDLVNKIYFPRETLPIAAMFARLFDFGIAICLLVALMLIFQVPTNPVTWLYLPIILVVQLVLMVGLGLAFAAANVYYRDTQSLVALGLQLWFYASPIIYPVTLVPESLRTLYYLNPMAGVITAYRAVLLNQTAPGSYLIVSGLVAVVIFFLGYWIFKRVEFQFADIV